MSSVNKHGGLKAFEPTQKMNDLGFIHKAWDNRIYPPFFHPDAIRNLQKTWDTEANDIFICTHQKVGTHLTKKFVCEILRSAITYPEGNGIKTGDIGHGTIAWPEVMVSQHGMDHIKKHLAATQGFPRIWYTHCSMHDLPFRSAHPQTRFIHVFRDPRGAFVSQYHFYRSHPMLGVSQELTYDDFLPLFIEGNLYFGDYHKHTLEWMHGCGGTIKKDNLLVLRYEDLVEKKQEATKRLADFILNENKLTEVQINQIIATTEFNTMKKELTDNPQSFHFNPQTFFRAGKSDDWKDKLNEAQIAQIDDKTRSVWGNDSMSHPPLAGIQTL
jgi:hypothetical protein